MKTGMKRALWAALVLALAAGGGWWIRQRQQAEAEKPKFRTAAIDRGPITQVVLATGTLQAVTTVNIGSQVSGTVMSWYADFNDHVKKGEVLLRLDPALLQARLRQARAQLAASQAALTLARDTYARNQRLVAAGFISALALDQSRRDVEAGQANVDLARAQVDSAQTDIDNSVIRSPIDGVVIKRNVDVGQTVAASFQTPDLYLLAGDLHRMQVATSVSEADVGLIRDGQEVRFTVDAYPDREFDGQVQQFRLNSTSTQGVVTYPILVSVSNPDEALKPGMTAQTRIVVAHKDGVVRLPTAALRFHANEDEIKAAAKAASAAGAASAAASASVGGPARADDDGVLIATRGGAKIYRVYTVGDKQVPRLHEVTIGIANTRFTELASVLGGSLKPGDEVITRRIDVPTAGNP